MHKHPYISATLIATLLAIVVWLIVPKEYTAIIKLSDEYKEMDVAIGLDRTLASLNDLKVNKGINDMEVYCKNLITEDFVRTISHKQVPGKGIDYGHWVIQQHYFWQTNDTIEAIQERINYNYSNKQETLKISFTDYDATVAAQMLDSVTTTLQDIIQEHRKSVRREHLVTAQNVQRSAAKKYHQALDSLSQYVDSHNNPTYEKEKGKEDILREDVAQALKYYNTASLAYSRQKMLMAKEVSSFTVIVPNIVPSDNDSHLIGYILSFVTISLISVNLFLKLREKLRKKDKSIYLGNIFSPWNITLIIWTIVLSLISMNTIIEPLSEKFHKCLFIWVVFFCTSSFAIYNVSKCSGTENKPVNIKVNMTIFNILFLMAMCMTPLYIYEVYKVVSMFGSTNILNNIRELSAHGEGFGILNLTLVIDSVLLIVALLAYPNIPLWKLSTVIFAWITYCIGTMAKGYFFMLFIYSAFILYERKLVKIRTMAIASCILLVFFYFFNLMRATEGSSYQENETLLDFISTYILSGPAAFGHVMENISERFGENVFWAVDYYIGRFITGEQVIHSMHKEFVYVPVLTNTYTILRPYYIDFGYLGVGIFALVYGTISGYIYRLYVHRNNWGICFYCYILYILVMQFFDDIITEGPMQIIQIAILLYLTVYSPDNKTEKI